MKKFIVLFALLPLAMVAQNKKFEIGIGAGNNGQLDKTLNDFYFFGHETGRLDDSKIDETANLKLNFSVGYRFNKNVGARLKFGYAMRKDDYTDLQPTVYNNFTIDQHTTNFSPGVFFTKDIERLQLSVGLEIPVYLVSTFEMDQVYRELQDSVNITEEQKGVIKMDGGMIWGVNNFLTMKYALTDWMMLGGEINYGLLVADIGDKVTMDYVQTIPSPAESHISYDKNYRKTFFSAPEVSCGLYFTF